MENPLRYFAEVRDPRVERNREHCRVRRRQLGMVEDVLTLPSGIPSHDTFNRVFAALDPEEMEKGFVAWVSSI